MSRLLAGLMGCIQEDSANNEVEGIEDCKKTSPNQTSHSETQVQVKHKVFQHVLINCNSSMHITSNTPPHYSDS